MENKKLIEVKDLKKYFTVGNNAVLKAVDGLNFFIREGETLGLVGESGCGKSTAGRTIIRLYEATGGEVIFDGMNVHKLDRKQAKDFTKKAQMIFQDPYASLNPRMTVGDIIGEGIDIHNIYSGKERTERIYDLLHTVGLNREHANRFPHEFSGGQRQRIGVARALAIEPQFIVCDEPISALDVSIQAQVVNLLINLQRDYKLTYLFIAHDLSMVKHISDRVGVMYLGTLVELASSAELYKKPMHPYTQALLSAIPIADPEVERSRKRILLEGDVPSPINPPPGCRFKSRCRYATDICSQEMPEFRELEKDHFVACHNV
ncbi:ABC transporter ATP-binding protein [Lutispora sp.]|uniref:ABC transporter ATP-binding protein n=1 Tax=Lutispora sp. TaxID=2828727 RepID=UPI000EDF4FDA|nr:oligopeptide/dipeptide ABC transporter ATP-binding protein [Lutispora sp.]MEA4961944.1 oligopeptide/dipeptide ABC transporter ATP-binding protein [Lutispora sp.]HCJ57962.1 oligopeptide ABC transporter ATP-binding protein OppF [Clostridiaceae bacterium]